MTTSELIAVLQKEDPEGTTPVVIDNCEVFSAHREAAFWDGRPLLLRCNPADAPYYNVVGAYYTGKGSKIILTALGLDDLFMNNPELQVDDETERGDKREYIEKRRAWAKAIIASANGVKTESDCPECGHRQTI